MPTGEPVYPQKTYSRNSIVDSAKHSQEENNKKKKLPYIVRNHHHRTDIVQVRVKTNKIKSQEFRNMFIKTMRGIIYNILYREISFGVHAAAIRRRGRSVLALSYVCRLFPSIIINFDTIKGSCALMSCSWSVVVWTGIVRSIVRKYDYAKRTVRQRRNVAVQHVEPLQWYFSCACNLCYTGMNCLCEHGGPANIAMCGKESVCKCSHGRGCTFSICLFEIFSALLNYASMPNNRLQQYSFRPAELRNATKKGIALYPFMV